MVVYSEVPNECTPQPSLGTYPENTLLGSRYVSFYRTIKYVFQISEPYHYFPHEPAQNEVVNTTCKSKVISRFISLG